MRTSAQRLVFAVVTIYATISQGYAFDDNLVGLLRGLTTIQSQIVAGDTTAREAERTQLLKIERAIASLDAEAMHSETNHRQIALFLLAGGKPAVVTESFSKAKIDLGEVRLIAAALDYAEGNSKDAVEKNFRASSWRNIRAVSAAISRS